MKFLVVGAGAVGGYFGGRLAENEQDVTFLVREKRNRQLAETGLIIKSVHGDFSFQPKTILSGDQGAYDVILLSTKAYQIDQALSDIEPYVQDNKVIIPMLNGMDHIHKLKERFSAHQVLGGLCFIESDLSPEGFIIQTSQTHRFVFGEWDGSMPERVRDVEHAFDGSKSDAKASRSIVQDMWEKYLFIAAMSGVTTLFRQPIGPIRKVHESREFLARLFKELESVMRQAYAPLSGHITEKHMQTIDQISYTMKSSMQRDMEKHGNVEADHLHGYLYSMASETGVSVPNLQAVYSNLKLYEKSRESSF
ncbi:ketopantoate reductase family protein [Metabacillus sp. KIGAM252]|uniref:2-dehydropantoate 2-reductase n=1 Tax=Metabacillus flavus TaxID=2823519 RepID=A0ABS5LF48_9BACI|nr:ketopantoate reductase family protein [Metabacillus flavus]MBS2969224.1 ketopantoate reductase family protein [Metabacillus flavus]